MNTGNEESRQSYLVVLVTILNRAWTRRETARLASMLAEPESHRRTRRMRFTIFLTLLLALPTWILAQEGDTLNIMPLGDSITMGIGSSIPGGYRDDLYWDLTIEGIIFDFVGTQNLGEGFDADHEGHGGKRSNWLADTVDYFYDYGDPDIILLHIGTNDITGGRTIPDIIQDIESILDQGKTHNPIMTMLVAGIVPRLDEKDSLTTALNNEILDLVNIKQIQGYDIKFVDHNTAFKSNPNWETELMADTRHPNDSGYAIMSQVWSDSLDLVPPIDSIPPSPIFDLAAQEVGPTTVKFTWSAPGDSDTLGIASTYDFRYSTSVITEQNFDLAEEVHSEPQPAPYGSTEEYIVSGLSPETEYYFGIKSFDEALNVSSLSNIPIVITESGTGVFVDDFNRVELGPRWVRSDSVMITDEELSSRFDGDTGSWTVRSVFSYARNPSWTMFRYGQDNSMVENGSVGIMMLRNSLNLNQARGYLIQYYNYAYHLYIMNPSLPPVELGIPIPESYPPESGDLLRVDYSRVGLENHFDVSKNGVYRGTLNDEDGLLDPETHYAGVAFENAVLDRSGEIDDFTVGGATGNTPPSFFALLSPPDSDTLDGDHSTFIWHRAIDIDPSPTVKYAFYINADSLFPSGPFVTDLDDTAFSLDTGVLEDTTYFWRVIAYDQFNDSTSSDETFAFLFQKGSGIDIDFPSSPDLPRVASLSQNYPNPFNPLTVIRYDVPLAQSGGEGDIDKRVVLRIYDNRGRLVRTLFDGPRAPGSYSVTWDGKNDRAIPVGAGSYIYTITIGEKRIVRKMVLMR